MNFRNGFLQSNTIELFGFIFLPAINKGRVKWLDCENER